MYSILLAIIFAYFGQCDALNDVTQNSSLHGGLSIHSRHHSHHHSKNGSSAGLHMAPHAAEWDCNRKWPELTLYLPLGPLTSSRDPRFYEFEVIFLRSLLLFWPLKVSNTSLMLVYDEERGTSEYMRLTRDTVKEIAHRIPGGVKFVSVPPFPYYRHGYDRQQYNMFYADNFTTSEYVGFIDADVAFSTYVDREDLFENGKPVVNARAGYHGGNDGVSKWATGTLRATGFLEPFKCMSYFPMIVKTVHLKEMREFISKYHNKTFDQAFYEDINIAVEQSYSQFSIFCTFLWHFHRNEYQW